VSESAGIFEFGPFRLESEERRLLCGDTPVPLTGKTFDTLLTLVRHHGRLVTKDRLLNSVWPDVVVDESNLTYHISILRKALGEQRTGEHYVETVPRQGYRFVAEVVEGHCGEPRPLAPAPDRDSEWVVERDEELRSLQEAAERARSGVPQLRFVCGEAGLGKTTLVNKFASEITTDASVMLATGACIEQKGEAEPYMPVFDALSTLARGPHRDQVVTALRLHAPSWIARMPSLLAAGSSTQTSAGPTQDRMLREIEEALLALASFKPLILVLADLHWSDYSTVDFIARLEGISEPARLLLICTYRPADAKSRSHPIHLLVRRLCLKSPDRLITLRPLTRTAVDEYVTRRFDQTFAAAVGPALYTRTEGNPLFINALLHSWQNTGKLRCDDGQWSIESASVPSDIPETLRDFLEQQISVLPLEQREILAVGSVARPHFWLRVVAAALDQPIEDVERECESLARAGQLITRTTTFEYPNGDVGEAFDFTHSLYAEVIYAGLSAGRCARLHRKVGDFLECAFTGQPELVAAHLAIHFREGRDRDRAVRYLLIAARQALRSSAHREAVIYLNDALPMARRLPDTPERERAELEVQALRAPALMTTRGFADPDAEDAFRRAVELAEQLNSELKFPAAFGLAAMFELRGEYLRSQELLEAHLPEQDRTGRYAAEWRHLLACSTFHQGQFAAALDHATKGLADVSSNDHSDLLQEYGEHPRVECHAWAGLALWFLGFPDQALGHAQEAATVLKGPNYAYALANGTAQIAMLHQLRREVQESLTCARAMIKSGQQHGMPYRIAIGRAIHGWACVQAGNDDAGTDEIRAAVADCEKIGAILDRPYFRALLAESLIVQDRLEEADSEIEQALQQICSSRSFFYEAELLRLRGCICVQRGTQHEHAEGLFRRAVELAGDQRAKALELRAIISWVKCSPDRKEPLALLDALFNSFTEGFDTPDLKTAAQMHRQRL
jgi:DNA-binding winged helix-turn-helix (wHTH) protein/tetratricopeptide (TPR) repeat protein